MSKIRQKIEKIASNPNIIEGIHNYCDRWCERCTHTQHCSVFLLENELKQENPDASDSENTAFWTLMSEVLKASIEMIQEKAKELGIELDDSENMETDFTCNNEELTEKAEEYGAEALKWLKENQSVFEKKLHAKIVISEQQAASFSDALQVVQWYALFIPAKLQRASIAFEFDDDIENTDNQGSAKIALIAIERSIAAFSLLFKELPEMEKEILHFLVDLSKLQKNTLSIFPNAMEFIRPGFDE